MEGRVINISLRKIWKKAPKWKRSSRAMKEIKDTVKKKTRAEEVKIGRALNETVWSRGSKKPPAKVRVAVIEEKENQYYTELASVDMEKRRKEREEVKEEEEEEEEEEKSTEDELKEKYMKKGPVEK